MISLLDYLIIPLYTIRKYLKKLTKDQRDSRIVFLGKRGKVRQYKWLHITTEPHEVKEDKYER
jgi:hypothetical protein